MTQQIIYADKDSGIAAGLVAPGTPAGSWDPAWLIAGKTNNNFNDLYPLLQPNAPLQAPIKLTSPAAVSNYNQDGDQWLTLIGTSAMMAAGATYSSSDSRMLDVTLQTGTTNPPTILFRAPKSPLAFQTPVITLQGNMTVEGSQTVTGTSTLAATSVTGGFTGDNVTATSTLTGAQLVLSGHIVQNGTVANTFAGSVQANGTASNLGGTASGARWVSLGNTGGWGPGVMWSSGATTSNASLTFMGVNTGGAQGEWAVFAANDSGAVGGGTNSVLMAATRDTTNGLNWDSMSFMGTSPTAGNLVLTANGIHSMTTSSPNEVLFVNNTNTAGYSAVNMGGSAASAQVSFGVGGSAAPSLAGTGFVNCTVPLSITAQTATLATNTTNATCLTVNSPNGTNGVGDVLIARTATGTTGSVGAGPNIQLWDHSNASTGANAAILQIGSAGFGVWVNLGAWAHVATFSNVAFSGGVDNTFSCGSSSLRWTTVYATTGTINTSDRREKHDFGDVPGTDFTMKLKPRLYKWKDGGSGEPGKRLHAGFFAQDVREAMGACEWAAWGMDDVNDPDSRQWLRPDQLIPSLVKTIQELEERIRRLESSAMQPSGSGTV